MSQSMLVKGSTDDSLDKNIAHVATFSLKEMVTFHRMGPIFLKCVDQQKNAKGFYTKVNLNQDIYCKWTV